VSRVERIALGVVASLGLSMSAATLVTEDWLKDEGWELTVYLDSIGKPTVCAGHTGPEVRLGDVWTEDECVGVTVVDLAKHGKPVLDALIDPTTGEIVAWIGFAGNTGVTNFLHSTGLRLQRAGQRVAACEQLPRWVYVTKSGRKLDCRIPKNNCRGLPIRRQEQLARCIQDIAA
jgi:lysozyme